MVVAHGPEAAADSVTGALHLLVHLAACRKLPASTAPQNLLVEAGLVEELQSGDMLSHGALKRALRGTYAEVFRLRTRIVRLRIRFLLAPAKQRTHGLPSIRHQPALRKVYRACPYTHTRVSALRRPSCAHASSGRPRTWALRQVADATRCMR